MLLSSPLLKICQNMILISTFSFYKRENVHYHFHWTHFRFKLITDDVKDCAHGGWNFIQNYDKVRLCSVSGLSAPGSDLWLHQRLFVTDFGENNCSLFVATCSKISLPQIVPCLQNLLALLFSNFLLSGRKILAVIPVSRVTIMIL